ncbi:MAG: hypothetical protein ACTSO6_10380, partial [Promethearchaeota archaeon]
MSTKKGGRKLLKNHRNNSATFTKFSSESFLLIKYFSKIPGRIGTSPYTFSTVAIVPFSYQRPNVDNIFSRGIPVDFS